MSSLPFDGGDIDVTEYGTQFEPLPGDENNLWTVKEILKEARDKYLVNWDGYDPTTGEAWKPSWVPKHDCTDDLIYEWKRNKARKVREKKRKGRGRASNTRSPSTNVKKDDGCRKYRSATISANATAGPSTKKGLIVEITRLRKRKAPVFEEEEESEEDSRPPTKKKCISPEDEVGTSRHAEVDSTTRRSSKRPSRVREDDYNGEALLPSKKASSQYNQHRNCTSRASSYQSTTISHTSNVGDEDGRAPATFQIGMRSRSFDPDEDVSEGRDMSDVVNPSKTDSCLGSGKLPSLHELLTGNSSFRPATESTTSSQRALTPVKTVSNMKSLGPRNKGDRERPLAPIPALTPSIFKTAPPVSSHIENFSSPSQKARNGKGKEKAAVAHRAIDRREEDDEGEGDEVDGGDEVDEEEGDGVDQRDEVNEEEGDEVDGTDEVDEGEGDEVDESDEGDEGELYADSDEVEAIQDYKDATADDELQRRGQKLADDANSRQHGANVRQRSRRSLSAIIPASVASDHSDLRHDDMVHWTSPNQDLLIESPNPSRVEPGFVGQRSPRLAFPSIRDGVTEDDRFQQDDGIELGPNDAPDAADTPVPNIFHLAHINSSTEVNAAWSQPYGPAPSIASPVRQLDSALGLLNRKSEEIEFLKGEVSDLRDRVSVLTNDRDANVRALRDTETRCVELVANWEEANAARIAAKQTRNILAEDTTGDFGYTCRTE
ncbi:hypothetical protein BU17DRAFT_72636 [Hysterangium stoloniferum]|nr:hypothetical protein BU17DRAFT_72636 [Hysterangium stoloniferum]